MHTRRLVTFSCRERARVRIVAKTVQEARAPSSAEAVVSATTLSLRGMLAVSALVAACASGGRSAVRRNVPLAPVITRAELQSEAGYTLLEVVRRIRPSFLASRGATSIEGTPMLRVLVVIDGMPQGDVDVLQSIRAADVRQVRRLSVPETYLKYGRSVSVGGLEVTLDRR